MRESTMQHQSIYQQCQLTSLKENVNVYNKLQCRVVEMAHRRSDGPGRGTAGVLPCAHGFLLRASRWI
jgi:hypothetical protein